MMSTYIHGTCIINIIFRHRNFQILQKVEIVVINPPDLPDKDEHSRLEILLNPAPDAPVH